MFDLRELKLMFLDPTDLIINNINKYLYSKKWAIKIETLHTYVPSSLRNEKLNDPMWE